MAAKVRMKQFNNTLFKIEINNSIANFCNVFLTKTEKKDRSKMQQMWKANKLNQI